MTSQTLFIKKALRAFSITILFGVTFCGPLLAHATTKEDAVKAGIVYNFTKYITWPAGATLQSNFNLCVEGNDQLDGGLEALYGRLVGNRPLILKRDVSNVESKNCHMVFVANDAKLNIKVVMQKFSDLPVVTVSDRADFIQQGGMIGLLRDGHRVGFEVNIKPAKAVGLRMSAQLLKLAKYVKGLK
jgi:hypothetical protein